jgi:hypothetical protein
VIRIEEDSGWILISHPDHARLAGRLADNWGNRDFAAPEPRAETLIAVARHDDAWAERDAEPKLTREGRPSAFSRELVGAYSAFEEMDLSDYLAVRGRAAAMISTDFPYAALVISMHTVDLLTEQADVAALGVADRALHGRFIWEQRRWQDELSATLGRSVGWNATAPRRAFEFLQACDSLSLAICVRYPSPITLRHRHPDLRGDLHSITCTPLGGDTYRIAPFPFGQDELRLDLPCRRISGRSFTDPEALRAGWAKASLENLPIRIVREGG